MRYPIVLVPWINIITIIIIIIIIIIITIITKTLLRNSKKDLKLQ